jgi:hypothetical protein
MCEKKFPKKIKMSKNSAFYVEVADKFNVIEVPCKELAETDDGEDWRILEVCIPSIGVYLHKISN